MKFGSGRRLPSIALFSTIPVGLVQASPLFFLFAASASGYV
jgi:hypothetical protein